MSLFAPTFQPTLFSGIPQSPTLSPTLTSISTPSTVSTSLNSSSLVLGMGVGTFLIIFFFVVLVFVFFLSFGCSSMQKFVWRSVSTIIFGIIFLCLALAPREDQYVIQSDELKDYDEFVNVRISISCVTAFFGIVALVILVRHKNEHIELYTIDHDSNTFWQDE